MTSDSLCRDCEKPTVDHAEYCWRCQTRRDGGRCSRCGSEWVYITAHDLQDSLLCRVCTLAFITLMGYDSPLEYLNPEPEARAETAVEQVAKMVRRRHWKQEGTDLFDSPEEPEV